MGPPPPPPGGPAAPAAAPWGYGPSHAYGPPTPYGPAGPGYLGPPPPPPSPANWNPGYGPGWPAPWVPAPVGPVAPRGPRVAARVLDLVFVAVPVAIVIGLLGDAERPWTTLALVWFVLFVYETTTLMALGASPGKAALGQRVIELDRSGPPSAAAAARRGAANAALAALPIVGWTVWASSTLGDALGRGVSDRAASTMVVPRSASVPVASVDLPGFADGARPPRLLPLGRVGDLDVRSRARLRRLVDVPWLSAAVGLLALVAAFPLTTATIVLASSAAWVVVFVIDETVRVSRRGSTPGHARAGLVIRSRRTGQPPGLWRSLARAAVLGLTLYVPLLWPLLWISMAMIRWGDSGRGLHDFAGGTVVVADPALDPEQQRQMAMLMRLGRAA